MSLQSLKSKLRKVTGETAGAIPTAMEAFLADLLDELAAAEGDLFQSFSNSGANVYSSGGLGFWVVRDTPMDIATPAGFRDDPFWNAAPYFAAGSPGIPTYSSLRLLRGYGIVQVAPTANTSAAGTAAALGRDTAGATQIVNATALAIPVKGAVYGLLNTEKGADLVVGTDWNAAHPVTHAFATRLTAPAATTFVGGVIRWIAAFEAGGPLP